jgi:Flp pilus assembly protein TadD
MARNRRRRYQDVSDLQSDINLYLEGRSVSAKDDSFAEAFSKLIKRNKGVASAIAVAAVIVVGVFGVAFHRVSTQRDIARESEKKARISEKKARDASAQQRKDALVASKNFAMQAAQMAASHRWIEAERRADVAGKVAKDSPWIFFAKGKIAEQRKQYDEAKSLFQKALDLDGKSTEIRTALAQIKTLKGEVADAQTLLADIDNEKDWKTCSASGRFCTRPASGKIALKSTSAASS